MNNYYITENCNELYELITEVYEGFYDDDGSLLSDSDYIAVGFALQRIMAKCGDMLEDIKLED